MRFLIDDIEIELCMPRCLTDNRHHIVDHRLIDGFAGHIDREALDALVLYRLQIFNVLYLQRIGLACGIELHISCFHKDRTADRQLAIPFAPLLSEERYLAGATEILYRDQPERRAALGELLRSFRDDTAKGEILTLRQLILVAAVTNLRAGRVTHIIKDQRIIIQRMSRKIDTHKIFLTT